MSVPIVIFAYNRPSHFKRVMIALQNNNVKNKIFLFLDGPKNKNDKILQKDILGSITKVGKYVRKFKLDELTQLINVLKGDISLVGPRPNVKSETDLYTDQELKLLSVKPGITDISSIVFSDEGEILKWHKDPDLAYNQLIRPWKSRLSLFYIQKRDIKMDILLILVTVLSIFSRKKSLKLLNQILKLYNAPIEILNISKRNTKLVPTPPPGSTEIVLKR